MEKMSKKSKKIIVKMLLGIILFISIFYVGMGAYSYTVLSMYDDKIYPNVYIGSYDISNMKLKDIKEYVNKIEKDAKDTKIVFTTGENDYEYKLSDLNVSIDKDKILNDILDYQKELTFFEKIKKIVFGEKKKFTYNLVYNDEDILNFTKELKSVVDCKMKNEMLIMGKDRVLKYDQGQSAFSLDVDKTKDNIVKNIYNVFINNKVDLYGDKVSPKRTNISTINTKISTYSTHFDNYQNTRGDNLRTGAKYIDGVILQPGETFNFYKYAGPYSKAGYEYYNGVIGNGVCQVASTLYNTTLLAGLKVTQRAQHAEQMPYVRGGLDATVSSRADGSPGANYQFKNIYKYPVYVSAFTNKGTLTIEFWSNENATGGRTFKTESEQIGTFAFKTYLVAYKDGKKVSRDYIATSYYTKMFVW